MGFTLNQLEQERQIRKLQKKEDKDTSNYEQLSNLPKINNVELKGDKTTGDLGINADNVMMSDGVKSVEDILTKKITYDAYAVGSNSSINITLPRNFRGCLITSGMSPDSLMGMYIIAVNSVGTLTVIKTISAANKLSVTGSNNILTITSTDGNNTTITLLTF